jgi:sulfide dehydrogenase cytochrome subunit
LFRLLEGVDGRAKPGQDEVIRRILSLVRPQNFPGQPCASRERVPSIARRVRVLPLVLGIATAAAVEPPPGATSCSGCHPPSASVEAKVPPLRGRDPVEIVAAIQAFRSGERPSTVMGRIAKGFSDDETRAIAAWLAAQR